MRSVLLAEDKYKMFLCGYSSQKNNFFPGCFAPGGLYGESFAFLSERPPDSVVFAEGSEIVVYREG